ncbi:MAG: nitrite/sulfite reductase [Candidatus Omnitrophica bacterium]|nr:nitrite/sulfite reductase [Candidatus Omnitrophota bacterium]
MWNLVLPSEIKRFEEIIIKLEKGEISSDDFKRFRLENGVYGIRGVDDKHMIRIKIPLGLLTSEQLDSIASATEQFAPAKMGHITTRQDIQVHNIERRDVPRFLSVIAKTGLTTREACGNTVRNVTACPYAGVSRGELFDVTPYAKAVTLYFLRNPLNQNLPRKFKFAFEGCPEDHARTPIHDAGIAAAIRRQGGKEERGFKIYVGGGLGSHPVSAVLLEPFTSEGLLLPTCEAIMRIFDRMGNRKNRSRARLKFLLEEWGEEKFRKTILEERTIVLMTRSGKEYPSFECVEEKAPLVSEKVVKASSPAFERWKKTNALEQKQKGFYIVHVRCPLGDVTVAQMRGIAAAAKKFCGGRICATITQNLILRWVPEAYLGVVYQELERLKLAFASAERFADITRCPGSDTCNLAITKSRGLAQALGDSFQNGLGNSADLKDIDIKISGCPNSCGQHHIAALGFYGTARNVNGKLVPHYELLVGGGTVEGKATHGEVALRIPARRIPEAVKYLVTFYQREKKTNEMFRGFLQRVGVKKIQSELEPFTKLESFDCNPDSYRDWTDEKPFALKVGKGECAA